MEDDALSKVNMIYTAPIAEFMSYGLVHAEYWICCLLLFQQPPALSQDTSKEP